MLGVLKENVQHSFKVALYVSASCVKSMCKYNLGLIKHEAGGQIMAEKIRYINQSTTFTLK